MNTAFTHSMLLKRTPKLPKFPYESAHNRPSENNQPHPSMRQTTTLRHSTAQNQCFPLPANKQPNGLSIHTTCRMHTHVLQASTIPPLQNNASQPLSKHMICRMRTHRVGPAPPTPPLPQNNASQLQLWIRTILRICTEAKMATVTMPVPKVRDRLDPPPMEHMRPDLQERLGAWVFWT